MSARDRLLVAVMATVFWAFSSCWLTEVFARASKPKKQRPVPAKYLKARAPNVMGDV